jgi:hypothetical protein
MKKAIVKKLAYLKPIQGLDMKSIIEQDRVEYHINVYKHRFICHACPIIYLNLNIKYLVCKRLLKQFFQIPHAVNIKNKEISELHSQNPFSP